jgi:putative ABC transport system ATP-binding protein
VTPLIAFDAISRVYGTEAAEVRALDGVDMTIEAGEFVAIMGPSGSGKSTAKNIPSYVDAPTHGTCRFKGGDVGGLSLDQRAPLPRAYIDFVFHGYTLLARASALKNVELPFIYKGMRVGRRSALAMEALEAVGLTACAQHDPSQLSGGQRQRVAIDRAIVGRPKVIMADEPTGNLDTARSREIMKILTRFNCDLGITIGSVTHEEDMADHAHRLISFVDGRITADGAPVQAA